MTLKIVHDDRCDSVQGRCDDCGELTQVRRVESKGLSGETRGYFTICYSCFGPRITWLSDNGLVSTPVEVMKL